MRGNTWAAFGLGLGLAVAAASVARADDKTGDKSTSGSSQTSPDANADSAFAFSSAHGILGCRELIDARATQSLSIRASLGEENESQNFDSHVSTYFKDLTAIQAVGGASALGLADVGAKISLEHIAERFHLHGTTTPASENQTGVGDLEFAAKVSFKLGPWISLGPYGEVEVNSGAIRVTHTNQFNLGGAATFALLNDRVAVHGNLAFVDLNGGKLALGFRLGASVVPVDFDFVLGRLVAYVDGLEYDGNKKVKGDDIRLAAGVQVLVIKLVTFEVTGEYKIHDGDLPRAIRDTGAYGVGVAGGANISF